MEQDFVSGLYTSINGKRLGSEDDFRQALQDDSFAKGLYDSINGKRLGTFDQFLEAVRGTGGGAVPEITSDSPEIQPTQEPPSYQPQSQTPLDLLANRPTPFIDKKGKSYTKLEDALGKAEKHVEDEQDNIFEYVGKKIGGTVKNTFKYGPGNPMAWFNAEVERSVKEDIRVNAAENKRKEIVKSINPKDVEPASYKDLYDKFLEETGDEETAVRNANTAIKTHTRRINEIYQNQYDKLKGKEKKVADDLLQGIQPAWKDLETTSEDFNNWVELHDKVTAQSKELDAHTDQYKDALTGILNVIGEAKNNSLSPTEIEAVVSGYVNTLPYDSPIKSKAKELYESSVKDNLWTSDGMAESIYKNTLKKGVGTGQAVLEFAEWLGKGLSRAMQGMDEANPINDKGLSELEKEQAFKSSNRAITQALIDPSSKYTGSISEQVVDKNGRRLVVRDGQVIDIRRPDGTKIFIPTKDDIKVAESYDPEKDKPREDYRGSSILYQGAQVVSDMVPMILIGAATGGTGAAAGAAGTTSSTTLGQVAGSTLISLGDYYQEGLEQTGSVGQAMLYAGTTAPLIGYVESKIGNIEAKLGRAITQAERKSIFEALKAEGQAVAKRGIAEYVTGPGGMARLTKVIRKVGELGNDVKDELIEEITNFPVEFAGKMVAGMDPGPAPKEELEATMILTPLVTMGLGGAKIMFDNQRDIDELVGYAALNKEHFETLGSQWVNSARTETEKAKRSKDFEAKKSAVNEVHDTFNYIDENNFTPKQTDALVELSFEKARTLYRLQTSNSDKTKADLNKKIAALDEKMATIMNSETRAAETYLADEEGVAEPDLITRPKEESDLGKDVVEPEIEEPAPGLGPEFDNFLATEGVKVETEVSLGDVEARMTNAEYIDVKELDAKADKLYQVWDRVDQDPRLTAETKEELKSKLENVITKLETYELATTDEVSTTTEGGAAKGVRIVGTKKIGKPSKFEVTPERIAKQGPTRVTDKDGNEFGGVFNYKDGKLSVNTKNGTIPIDQNTLEFKQSVMENGTVVGAEVYDRATGHTFTIGQKDLALDMALKAKEMAFGVAEEPLFEQVFSEVTSKSTTTKRLVREGQVTTTPTSAPVIEVAAPKIEVTTDVSQQPSQDKPDNKTTNEQKLAEESLKLTELEAEAKDKERYVSIKIIDSGEPVITFGNKIQDSTKSINVDNGLLKDLTPTSTTTTNGKNVVSYGLTESQFIKIFSKKDDNKTTQSGGDTNSTPPAKDETIPTEQELETVLEPLGKTQKEREGQIEKFFTSKDSSVDKDTAKEQAKLTARVWQSVAKFFGKRNRQTADEYITSKLRLIGQTFTGKNETPSQMARRVARQAMSSISNFHVFNYGDSESVSPNEAKVNFQSPQVIEQLRSWLFDDKMLSDLSAPTKGDQLYVVRIFATSESALAEINKRRKLFKDSNGTNEKAFITQKELDDLIKKDTDKILSINPKDYVIKKITDSYLLSAIKFEREVNFNEAAAQTYEDILNNPNLREQMLKELQEKQIENLNRILNYLNNNRDSYVDDSILSFMNNILTYNVKDGKITKRSDSTVGIHTPINPAAFSDWMYTTFRTEEHPLLVYDRLSKANAETLSPEEIKRYKKSYQVEERPDGTWLKFPQGTSTKVAEDLNKVASISKNFPAQWCTGGALTTAQSQLEEGDFYIFLSKDGVPRLAMRYTNNNMLAESRGLGEGQLVLPEDLEEAKHFYDNYPGGKKYASIYTFNKMWSKYKDAVDFEDIQIEDLYDLYKIYADTNMDYSDGSYDTMGSIHKKSQLSKVFIDYSKTVGGSEAIKKVIVEIIFNNEVDPDKVFVGDIDETLEINAYSTNLKDLVKEGYEYFPLHEITVAWSSDKRTIDKVLNRIKAAKSILVDYTSTNSNISLDELQHCEAINIRGERGLKQVSTIKSITVPKLKNVERIGFKDIIPEVLDLPSLETIQDQIILDFRDAPIPMHIPYGNNNFLSKFSIKLFVKSPLTFYDSRDSHVKKFRLLSLGKDNFPSFELNFEENYKGGANKYAFVLTDKSGSKGQTVYGHKGATEDSLLTLSSVRLGSEGIHETSILFKPKIFKTLGGKINLQSPAQVTQQMADQLSANLLTHLDTMIEERTNPSKVAKALKENRGLTKASIKDQVERLKEVKARLLDNGRVSYQNGGTNRGALIEYAKNEMIVVALESPNVSTAIHELYHVFQGDLSPDEVQTIVDSYNEAFGTTHTISDLNGKVATDVEEWGARLWEKYFENGRKLTEKEVPNQKARNSFQNIFDKFTEWMKGVYNGVISYTNSDGATREVNMSKPVQDMFDKIIGIKPMETTNNAAAKEDDLSFLRDLESFDFDNLKTACVKL
jgi:hypothetical protein